jgi:hypothetical protein
MDCVLIVCHAVNPCRVMNRATSGGLSMAKYGRPTHTGLGLKVDLAAKSHEPHSMNERSL